MSFTLSLLFIFTSFATTTIKLGEKYYLKKASSYHFSDKSLIRFKPKNSPPFFIAVKPGKLKYQIADQKKEVLILNSEQNQFYQELKNYMKYAKHLKYNMDKNFLILEGRLFDLTEFKYLLKNCSTNKGTFLNLDFSNINNPQAFLKKEYRLETSFINHKIYSLDPHHRLHSCFSKIDLEKEFHAHFILIENSSSKTKNYGVGATGSIPWSFNPSLSLSEFLGEATHQKNDSHINQLLNFKALISKGAPLTFNDGTEFQISNQRGLFSSKISWKKALTAIEITLLSDLENRVKIKTNLKQTFKTDQAGILKTNSYSKQINLFLGKWRQILSFQKNNDNHTKKRLFGSSLLGNKGQGREKSSYSLWVKVGTHE